MSDIRRLHTYLIFDEKHIVGVRKGRPRLEPGQYAVGVTLEVPTSYFDRAFPAATVQVPERAIIEPVVTVEVPDE